MNPSISRRDFLKFSSLLSSTYFLPQKAAAQQKENVLVLVFDAWSAAHISQLGYPRRTMPNLGKLLDRATVYHQHYAGGTFTTPGTATLLTGTLPWTHRAYNVDGSVIPDQINTNIFNQFTKAGYYGFAYSHNPLADLLLRQFRSSIDQYFPEHEFFLRESWMERLLINDIDNAVLAARQILTDTDIPANSLFLNRPYRKLVEHRRDQLLAQYADQFPRGLPSVGTNRYFILEDSINWLIDNTEQMPQPFVGYFHFYPPHEPYITRREFQDTFSDDGFTPLEKPMHPFSAGESHRSERYYRRHYDESILYVDAEFKRLYDHLEQSGLLENTWLVLTADHGELFERGTVGHTTESFFDPVIRTPLFIFEPGATHRKDVYQPTSAADVLPSLLHLTENPQPEFTEGLLLPPYNADEVPIDRSIFGVHGRYNPQQKPLDTASVMLVKWPNKLVAYRGYKELQGEPMYELFNLAEDPQELVNLYAAKTNIAAQMREEIIEHVNLADEPYR